MTVLPNTIPDPGPAQPRGSGFLFAGRLEHLKGVDMLLESWAAADLPDGSRLVIAGDGPLRDEVARFAAARDDVDYVGPVDRARVRELMDAASVVLVPSRWFEAMPMVVVEAYSRGRPVLATGHGAMVDLVDDECGWLIEPTVQGLSAGLSMAAAVEGPAAEGPRARYERDHHGEDGTAWLIDRYREVAADG